MFEDAKNLLQDFACWWLFWMTESPLVCSLAQEVVGLIAAAFESWSWIIGVEWSNLCHG